MMHRLTTKDFNLLTDQADGYTAFCKAIDQVRAGYYQAVRAGAPAYSGGYADAIKDLISWYDSYRGERDVPYVTPTIPDDLPF
jgi:hypothetical protein